MVSICIFGLGQPIPVQILFLVEVPPPHDAVQNVGSDQPDQISVKILKITNSALNYIHVYIFLSFV